MTATLDCRVGLLLRRQFRQELERLRFYGDIEDFLETKHWIESDFSIRGNPSSLQRIRDHLAQLGDL